MRTIPKTPHWILFSLELFEDISFIMAKHADPQGVPDTPDQVKPVSDTSYGSLWEVSFTLKEF